MVTNLKKIFNVLSVVVVGGFLLFSCEPDSDKLGEQLFINGEAQANETSYDLIAYNLTNNDTVRSDASRLDSATIGVFKDPIFGSQSASYATQLRLSTYDPDFGTNPVVDSVVMVMKPYYNSSNVTTFNNESFVYPDGNVDAKVTLNTYPAKKFGNTAIASMNVKVEEVTSFLDGYTDKQYSNKVLSLGNVLGTTAFDGNVKSVAITRDSDNSTLYSSDAGIRILLDNNFFQSKILNMQNKPELQNAANFIRYIKGLKISMTDNDGYLMTFSPNNIDLKMYYRYDKTDNGTTTMVHNVYPFLLNSGNTHVGLIQYDRSNASQYTTYVSSTPNMAGDQKVFLQAMGGPSMGVKIPETAITQLKQLYQNNKAAIVSAKIRVYTDNSIWTNDLPKPDTFNIITRTDDPTQPANKRYTYAFTSDLTNYGTLATFSLYKYFNLDQNPAYYDFSITKTLKDIVEGGEDYSKKDFVIGIGNFLSGTSATTGSTILLGNQYTSRARAYKRIVLVGSETGNQNRIQMKVVYGTK